MDSKEKEMSYFDNVNWDKLDEMAEELAMKDLREKWVTQLPDDISQENISNAIYQELSKRFSYVLERMEYHRDYIWLMGPVPMKKGYVTPTIDLWNDYLNTIL